MNFTKYYKSTPEQNEPKRSAYFAIEYCVDKVSHTSFGSITVEATISYLCVMNGNRKEQGFASSRNSWKLYASKDRCSLNNSVMITPSYRSFKIGSFLLNELLNMAIELYPEAPLRVSLSTVDEEGENKERRNRLYEGIGLIRSLTGESASIEKIGKLTLRNISQVKEIDINQEFDRLTDQINELDEELKSKIEILRKNSDETVNNILLSQQVSWYKTLFWLAIAIAIGEFVILQK